MRKPLALKFIALDKKVDGSASISDLKELYDILMTRIKILEDRENRRLMFELSNGEEFNA